MSTSTFTPTNLGPSADLAQDVGRSDLRFGTGYFVKLSDGDRVVATGEVVTENDMASALANKADNVVASAGKSGLMAASDKRKLDGLPDQAVTSHEQLDNRDAANSHPAAAIAYSPTQTVADAIREIAAILPNKVDYLDVSNFASRNELLSGLAGKADWAYVDNNLSAKADKAGVDVALAGKAEAVHSHVLANVDGLEQLLETLARTDYVDAGLALKAGLATATRTTAGLMSAADKNKLDELDPSGVPIATATSPGVVKPDDETIKIDADGTLRVTSLPPGETATNHADLDGRDAAGSHPSSAISHDGATVAAALADLLAALNGKADAAHTQAISSIINLQSSLDAKANTTALASYATITALNNGLADKANASHSHALADINNLVASLAEKANASALASYATITALNNGLAGKANASHSHAIADVANLQTGLDAKAALASPAFTGAPTAPTAAGGTATKQLATCEFVQTALSGAGGGFTAMEIKTASGSWKATKTGVVRVTLIGGGGGGGKGFGFIGTPYPQGGSAGGTTAMNSVSAYGGGGGGGGGSAGMTVNYTFVGRYSAGGGGGAGQIVSFYMNVTQGASYPFTVGAGGAGGSTQTSTASNSAGASTTGAVGGIGGRGYAGGGGGGGGGAGKDASASCPYDTVDGSTIIPGYGGDGGVNGTAYGGGGGGGAATFLPIGSSTYTHPGLVGRGGANGANGSNSSGTTSATGVGGNGGNGGAGAVIIEY